MTREQVDEIVKELGLIDLGDAILYLDEMRIVRVHIDEQLLVSGTKDYIDPEKWNPLIMNLCEFFGLSDKIHPSRLEAVFYGLPRQDQEQAICTLEY